MDYTSGCSIQTITFQQPQTNTEVKNMDYIIVGFILAVMIICIVTVKFVLPHVTLKNIMKGVVRLVIWPFKKAYQEVNNEWKNANKVSKKKGR